MPRGLQVLHHEVFVFRIDLGVAIGARQQVHGLVAALGTRRLEVGHAADVAQPYPLADFARHRQRVAGEHLHRNAEVVERGDELPGVGPRRIVQGHQAEQRRDAVFGAARHCQRPVALGGGVGDARLQRGYRRSLQSAGLGDRAHGAFHHAQPLPVLVDHGFGPAAFRIEGREGDRRRRRGAVEDVMRLCRGQEGEVDRILVGFLGGERTGGQHLGFRRLLQRDHAGDGELVQGDGAGLVHAEHVHGGGVLGGGEPRHQHAALGQLLRSDRHADGEHHRQGHRHRAHQQHQHQRDHLHQRGAADQGQHDHQGQQRADDDEQPAHDLGHHCLDVQLRPCALHQLRGAAEVGLGPGQHDHAVAFAAADDGARGEHFAGALVCILRLAGERGLVDAQGAGHQLHVRRDDVSGPHANDVAGNQLAGRNDLPVRIAQHARADLQPPPQGFDDAGGAAFLHEAQYGIDEQQGADHSQVRVLPQGRRQCHDQFQHPGRNAPELAEELAHRVFFLFGHFVVAVLLAADIHLSVRESGVGIDVKRRQGVGERSGGDVWRLGVSRLRGGGRGLVGSGFHVGFSLGSCYAGGCADGATGTVIPAPWMGPAIASEAFRGEEPSSFVHRRSCRVAGRVAP
ncbi:hypothetical protein GALL_413190 [mine drainage metagenome]|uniref:Uncharacterized protein n=1 Tax=mine drainage metagenome TaxID=410659 RepID=A0A1J5Q0Y3_9ZZZZ